jgi:mannan endo-1,4-beta-mannosidase
MYCDWTTASKIDSQLQSMKNANLPIIIGEFGNNHPPCGNLPYKDLMRIAQAKGIGYLAWSWKGNTTGTLDQLDLSNNWSGTSLKTWGYDLVNDTNGIRKTAKDATVFGGGSSSSTPSSNGASCNWYNTTFPICANTSSGWGWENNQSCVARATCAALPAPYGVVGGSTSTAPSCVTAVSDPDGDGWGWENNQSCKVTSSTFPACNSAASDPDGDGWGWENNRSCKVR